MESIDALIFMIIGAIGLIFSTIITYWYISLPAAILIGFVWYKGAKCPKCGSLATYEHQTYSKRRGFRPDWVPVIDKETGDWHAERFNRTCAACGHKWISEISGEFDDPRPRRKKILDGKSMKALDEYLKKSGGKLPFD
jgi:hypothetical protein